MLFQIQKELKENKGFNVLISVENDFRQYKKLKKEFGNLSDVAKQQKLSSETKVFLLLSAVDKEDLEFVTKLIKLFDYDSIGTTAAKTGLGRFYVKCGQRTKAIEYLFPLFEEEQLQELDIATLFSQLKDEARHKDCDRVLQYALNKFTNLGWKIQALTYQISISHIYPKNSEFISNNLNYLKERCTTAEHYYAMGSCFYLANYFDNALEMYDIALQQVSPIPGEKDNLAPFDASECRNSMDEIINILECDNIKVFPIAGSLLGLYRDGKFMDHDKDADVGIFVENYDEIFSIVSKLCINSKFSAPDMIKSPKESHEWNVAIYDDERITVVDLFFFYRKENHIEYGVYTPCAVLKWTFPLFNLVRQTLAGKEYWLADDIEQHLRSLYGDWKTPVKVWDSILECPNISLSSRPVVLYFGLIRLYQSIQQTKFEKATNYYKNLTERWGMKFSSEADANIKKILNIS